MCEVCWSVKIDLDGNIVLNLGKLQAEAKISLKHGPEYSVGIWNFRRTFEVSSP